MNNSYIFPIRIAKFQTSHFAKRKVSYFIFKKIMCIHSLICKPKQTQDATLLTVTRLRGYFATFIGECDRNSNRIDRSSGRQSPARVLDHRLFGYFRKFSESHRSVYLASRRYSHLYPVSQVSVWMKTKSIVRPQLFLLHIASQIL